MFRIFNNKKYYSFSKEELNIIKSLKDFFDDEAFEEGLGYIDSLNSTISIKFDIVTKNMLYFFRVNWA